MEHHDLIRSIAASGGMELDDRQVEALSRFSEEVFSANRLFNLTGHDSVEKIIRDLVFSSIIPLKQLNVPRGTSFCDLGSGAGVPGIPVAVMRGDLSACLVDSSEKKTAFISGMCVKLGLDNVSVINSRAEDLGRQHEYRDSFSFALSRAMGAPYVVLEVGAPLIAVGGFIYVYSSLSVEELHTSVLSHAERLGLEGIAAANHKNFGIAEEGLMFIKKKQTESRFPRRYSVISREADKIR